MRTYVLICLAAVLLFGCAHNPVAPGMSVDPSINSGDLQTTASGDISYHNPHQLWAAGNIYIDADHEKVELVPFRMGGVHLNVLKFFEESCDNCLMITGASNNGDGTFNLTIEITHPFPNHPELTVFDPKLILMFQGSHVMPENKKYLPLYPLEWRLSWRLMGDPEILNADGYSYFWSPAYDSGIGLPIFQYWEGKYAFGGTPTANLNAYLNYYSNEERHMLESGKTVERTFLISLPTGPSQAGYALDVCWEPPTNMPVVNPVDDFPITANQPEAYLMRSIYSDDNVINNPNCCNMGDYTVTQGRVEFSYWYLLPDIYDNPYWGAWTDSFEINKPSGLCPECDSPDPDHIRCISQYSFGGDPPGTYQILAYFGWYKYGPNEKIPHLSFEVFEVILDF
jgi:hypothetical protein